MAQRDIKRPYAGSQPHITSYFPQQPSSSHNTQSSSSQPSYAITHPPTSSTASRPSIPASVQSNLLNVGMRIRKSVPEGYKTGSDYSAFGLFNDQSKSSITANSPPNKTRPRANAGVSSPSASSSTEAASGPRELLPFCGLLKVGGLGAQQGWGIYSPTHETKSWTKYDCHTVDVDALTPEEEEVPALSQGSTISSSSQNGMASPTRLLNKRRCEWDDSDEDSAGGDLPEENFQHSSSAVLGGRVIAVPRGRGKRKGGSQLTAKHQESTRVVNTEDMDFEEATFLDFNAGFGREGEVEMGGV